MAIDFAVVLIIGVLRTKDGGTDTTRKMLDMVFAVERGDVRSTQGFPAIMTQQIKSPKIVLFAQRVLALAILIVHGKEFGGHDRTTVLFSDQQRPARKGQ